MPIQTRCQCGKALKIPDAMAGKAVKCPACGQPLKVPAAGASAGGGAAPAPSAPAPSAPSPASDRMDDLFNEEGFSDQVEAVCPICRAEMAASAVLCTKCGYHKESGVQFESHKTAGVDVDHGTLALEKAEQDIIKEREMQQKLLKGAGLPWWGLALVLFMIGSGLTIAVLAVNASRRVDETLTFNPVATFFAMSGSAFYLFSQVAVLMIVVHAFKQSVGRGLMTLLIPLFIFYHVFTNWSETWKFFVAALVLGGIGGGFFAAAVASGL